VDPWPTNSPRVPHRDGWRSLHHVDEVDDVAESGGARRAEAGQDGAMDLRMATTEDAAAVQAIYAPYVESTPASFELVPRRSSTGRAPG
jgi:hypothetical protein